METLSREAKKEKARVKLQEKMRKDKLIEIRKEKALEAFHRIFEYVEVTKSDYLIKE
jgi:hypothetical protein